MDELWQLYDEQGRTLKGLGGTKESVLSGGLLHGASHVWMWRNVGGTVQILFQKRAADKRAWPNYYDISAAGHIDVGEDPLTAAVRETKEELGYDVPDHDLEFIGVDRRTMKMPDQKYTENEICWLYAHEIKANINFKFQDGEVDSVVWIDFGAIEQEIDSTNMYVPHGKTYYSMVLEAIARLQNSTC